MTNATKAFSSAIYFSEDGVSYTKIAHSRDLQGPQPEVGEVPITNNDSPDNTEEVLPGLIRPGEIEFEVVYEKVQSGTLYGLMDAETVYYWGEEYPDGSGWRFRGFVNGFGTEGETEDGHLVNTMGIRLTGKPTHHAAVNLSGS